MSVRLLVDPVALRAGALTLSGDEHHYLSKVRRLAVGAHVVLLDGAGRMASAELRDIGSSSSQLWVEEPETLAPPRFQLHVAPALIKGERMDLAITKMVELGVHQISPLSSERSVVKLSKERALGRHKRFESLALAASRQCQNPHPTVISEVKSLPEWLDSEPAAELKLIPYLGAAAEPLASVLPDGDIASALVMIGPEGGFSESEAQAACTRGFRSVSLGPRTLRAETASIYMASVLGFRYGDVGSR